MDEAAAVEINIQRKIFRLDCECIIREEITAKYIMFKIILRPDSVTVGWCPLNNKSPRICCQSPGQPAKNNTEKQQANEGSPTKPSNIK